MEDTVIISFYLAGGWIQPTVPGSKPAALPLGTNIFYNLYKITYRFKKHINLF